ncbi:hypothetical protein SAMN05216355_11519 [Actinomyces ruminicola]|uniref:DUF4870 domain-containing protein n=1 Tax=Actinomyces ruminicola TaxID=332524 RepID=A0A1H0EBS6_9ACTO|nr:hypothetical protein [Actinomyces ruminicola]SDN79789.1 hypothetical protein SAMN05216355_11519 [Actinomyces ruminicola]
MPQQVPPPPDGGPYYPQARPRPTDAYAWCMGLIVFMMIPGLGSIVASIAMIAVGLRCRRRPEPMRTNGTAAASWGINYLLATLIFPGGFFLTLIEVLPADSGGFFPWGALGLAWMLISLFHVIICIAFGVRASRGKVVPFRGIPFIK